MWTKQWGLWQYQDLTKDLNNQAMRKLHWGFRQLIHIAQQSEMKDKKKFEVNNDDLPEDEPEKLIRNEWEQTDSHSHWVQWNISSLWSGSRLDCNQYV